MMLNTGGIDSVEDVLMVRIDHKNTVLHVIYHNKFFRNYAQKIIGKNFQNLGLESENCERCEAHLNMVFLYFKKEVFQLQIRNRCYHISYLPEWNGSEQVETVLAIVRDITKERKLKEELTISQTKSKIAGEIAKLGYFEWDQHNNVLHWSDQQYRNFGYTPQSVIPTIELFHRQIHPEDFDKVQATFAEGYNDSYTELQFRVIKADGSLSWLYSRLNVIMNEEGCRVKIFGITQDITGRKQAEERILRVEKELIFTNQLHSRSTYLNRLLFNDYSAEYISKALNEFGIETQRAYCCFLVQLTDKLVDTAEISDEMISPPIVRKQAVLLWLAAREWGLVWRCHDHIVVLPSISDHITANKQRQMQYANDIIADIEKVFPHFYVRIGISGTSSIPVDFCDLYEKARRAVVIPGAMNCSSAIHCDDIGLYEVAFQLLQDENTCAMVENKIGRLAEYDEARGSNLLITLECILEHVSLKTVAQKLFIHYNTVIWRKRRIEVLLKMTLEDMETKMLLMLYIKIWNLKKNS